MKRISQPFEALTYNRKAEEDLRDTDFLVVGSGYGGAVAAMRLACEGDDKGDNRREVIVLERGREYDLGDFPYDIEDLPSHLRVVTGGDGDEDVKSGQDNDSGGYSDALFNLHIGSNEGVEGEQTSAVDVLVGSGLGGTSLINANVAERPAPHVFKKKAWPRAFRDTPSLLDAAYDEVGKKLGITTRHKNGGREFPKYTALHTLARKSGVPLRPANIAVTTKDSSNGVGVRQNACTDCGNCVTGCNVGAKNTLDRNLLRLAKSRGAVFYTQVTVHSIEPSGSSDYPWRLKVRSGKHAQEPLYSLRAKNVILAAGTLGSTEILFRSQTEGNLDLSPELGNRFSTNGDGIVMSYGQKRRVGAIACAEQANPSRRPGPTITGIVPSDGMTLEEASIPAPLARIFAELVTTGAMLQRLSKRKMPYMLAKKRRRDALAASMEVAEHSQAFLVMGDDGAPGRMLEREGKEGLDIRFPPVKEMKSLNKANDLVRKQDRRSGLDKGQYVPNPLWELLPEEAGGVMSGDMPEGRALTVHPLGGCAMADSVEEGVVDSDGRVFNRAGGVYQGLYVFDGAIVPSALEVNPFMTIAALAWRNCDTILRGLPASKLERVSAPYADVGAVPTRNRVRPQATEFRIEEQLTGKVEGHIPFFDTIDPAARSRIKGEQGLVLAVTAKHEDGEQWLENPGALPLSARMVLSHNKLSSEQVAAFRPVGVHPAHSMPPFLELQGSFTILQEDDYGWFSGSLGSKGFWGGLKAVYTYFKRRRGLSFDTAPGDSQRGLSRLRRWLKNARVFLNIGILQSRHPRLSYAFSNPEAGVSVRGEKVLGFSRPRRVWPELLQLELVIADGDGNTCTATVRVNPENLLDPGLVQVEHSAHLPQSLLFAGGAAAYFARSMVSTNFWEFGGTSYKKTVEPPPAPGPLRVKGRQVFPEDPVRFKVPLRDDESGELELELTRYKHEGKPPLLLLHGLAQGSQIFWTDSLDQNLAESGYREGYDVWLLDYRLSNRVLPYLRQKGADYNWTLDEVARFDIPMAIEKVWDVSGQQPVSIITHCVSASALAMAILGDDCADQGKRLHNKIRAIVSNAIHPWVITSTANRFRAKFGAFFREWMPTDTLLNPLPKQGEGAMQNAVDRLAFSLARISEQEEDRHQDHSTSEWSQGICDRMTFLYGLMWNHRNLAGATHEAFGEMLGPAPMGVYQHLYYYSELRRLSDSRGANVYLQTDRIRANWKIPTLFIHGGDSQVFNPHSARRSAVRMNLALRGNAVDGNVAAMTVPIGYRVFPGYGHMDPILGREAHARCYPEYFRFFTDPGAYVEDPIGDPDWPTPFPAKPDTGPILRAAWREGGNIRLRYWAEMKTNLVERPRELLVTQDGRSISLKGRQQEIAVPYDSDSSGPRYRFVDVEVDDGGPSVEVLVGSDVSVSANEQSPYSRVLYRNEAWLERLRTRRGDRVAAMRFVVGSCRFPGSVVDNQISDGIFAAIRSHIFSTGGAQLLFLVGDQIYADATDQLYEARSSRTRYRDRYRRAFRSKFSPAFAALARHIPTHFALDDHEIDDNWSGLPPGADKDSRAELEFAVNEAARYMGSARNQQAVLASVSGSPFYYALAHPEECDFPVFVADTRTERAFRLRNEPRAYEIMSQKQYQQLEAWLKNAHDTLPDVPKFIVSGSIVVPLASASVDEKRAWRNEDGWAGYPATLERLLGFIADNSIEKVVFVGGDAHLSSVSKIELDRGSARGGQTEVWQIVSSGLYAPYPFANSHREDFNWSGEDEASLRSDELEMHLDKTLRVRSTNYFLSDHYQQFVSVDVREDSITVSCHRMDDSRPAVFRILFPEAADCN